jgi:hypothetical protein
MAAAAAEEGSMTMADFTPGPWATRAMDGVRTEITAPDPRCPGHPWSIALMVPFAGSRPDGSGDQSEANARLIASAPIMMAALEDIARNFDHCEDAHRYDNPGACQRCIAEAAIARATGGA